MTKPKPSKYAHCVIHKLIREFGWSGYDAKVWVRNNIDYVNAKWTIGMPFWVTARYIHERERPVLDYKRN